MPVPLGHLFVAINDALDLPCAPFDVGRQGSGWQRSVRTGESVGA